MPKWSFPTMTPELWAMSSISVALFAILVTLIVISVNVTDCEARKDRVVKSAGKATTSWLDSLVASLTPSASAPALTRPAASLQPALMPARATYA